MDHHQVFTIILAGGRGKRLYNLTKNRAKPSLRFGGYSLIEIMINLVENSGFDRRIDVYTEHLTDTLTDVLDGWSNLIHGHGQWVKSYPTQHASIEGMTRGSGDALLEHKERRERLRRDFRISDDDAYLVLSADHVTNLDLGAMVDHHFASSNDITLAIKRVPVADAAGRLGSVILDVDGSIIGFDEKTMDPPQIPGDPGFTYVNLANIVYRPSLLDDVVIRFNPGPQASKYDQSEHLLKRLVDENRDGRKRHTIGAYVHDGYWTDVGDPDSFFLANMDLIHLEPLINLYEMVSRTMPSFRSAIGYYSGQGAKITDLGTVKGSITNNGDIISGAVSSSVLSYAVVTERDSVVERSVLFDRVYVAPGARVKDSILDKETVVGEGAVIDPANLSFYLQGGGISGKVPKGYRVTPIGKSMDHILIQASLDGSPIPAIEGEYIGESVMEGGPGVAKVMVAGSERNLGNYLEAVLTPGGKLVLSKYSHVPAGLILGK